MNFVLVTPARNEELLIGKTMESVVGQSVLPVRWVVVDDGSTDRTAEIVERYARRHDWIELLRRPPRRERSFAGKVFAFNAGFDRLQSLEFQLIANLDADVLLEPDHFEFLIQRFAEDPALGVAGTAYVQGGSDSTRDSFEGEESVAGPLQFFRKECFQQIGGFVPNHGGGIDWIAVTTARLKGWKTRNFPQRKFMHQRFMGTAERSNLRAMFDYGKKDYFLGRSPIWEVFRALYRSTKRPLLWGGLAVLSGYIWAAATRMQRPVSGELIRFHRQEQMRKLKAILRSMIRLKRIERFYLPGETDRTR